MVKCPMPPFQSCVYSWVKATGTLRQDPHAPAVGRVRRGFATLNNKCMELRKVRRRSLTGAPVQMGCTVARGLSRLPWSLLALDDYTHPEHALLEALALPVRLLLHMKQMNMLRTFVDSIHSSARDKQHAGSVKCSPAQVCSHPHLSCVQPPGADAGLGPLNPEFRTCRCATTRI